MEFKEFKSLLFDKAKKEGFEECEVYYINRESLSISVYEEEVEKYNLNNTFGLSFRGKMNGKMGYSYTEILDGEAIDMLVKNAKDGANSIESEDIQFIYDGDKEYSNINTYSKDLDNIDAEKLIKIALEMEKETKKSSDKVVNVGGCSLGYGNSSYGIYNTKGLELTNKTNLLTAYVVPIIEVNGEKYDGTGYVTANSINEVDAKKIAKQGVDEALSRVNGKSIQSGKYKTIIFNEAMVSLLGTFAGIFDGDAAQKGLSLLKGKEGEMIASDIVTIVDNPLLDNGLASTPFDDEGVATFKKEVVSKGKLITLLHNLKTANKAGIKTTGNGFKASYASTVGIAPTNFYIEKGEDTLEELMKEIGEGLMVTEFAGLHSGANSVTGEFSLAAKGFYIEGGKKSYPVEQITVAGNYFELLNSIEKIGSDLKFPMSSVGSPSVIVKELSIAGK
ncbi:TldD/PmbA family protein [Clostridium sp. SHJSY1]|uniref:TldD/PmbA family protein n=1 Tax=Clostridium sp. SHJSY1 TaxID=2942483 RepID=UPI002875D185|nr:TldD/PmbA family protein [Clostridium sp. SHJSY1]MDS0528104.1 TldD/PmbA family protein [Clostridium sp. SHJSY1]